MKKASIVLGLGYGDEGKGLVTSTLCNYKPDFVVRFNGGHQAGHTVVYNGIHHVFSNFGSGTLQGIPTYWSKFCTVHPTGLNREYKILKEKGITPRIYFDPLCPITTPWEIFVNRKNDNESGHGSVGVGFGATIQRQEDFYKLHIMDIYSPQVFKQKLNQIADYYYQKGYPTEISEREMNDFLEDVEEIKKFAYIFSPEMLYNKSLVFEGAQGILLDMDMGFFPNVTRSNTTSKNTLELLEYLDIKEVDIFYVTRSYQTRHGNGWMSKEGELNLVNNENETNKDSSFQGKFRKGEIDFEMINYSLECDRTNFVKGIQVNRNLMITCLDQYPVNVSDFVNSIKFDFQNIATFQSPETQKNFNFFYE